MNIKYDENWLIRLVINKANSEHMIVHTTYYTKVKYDFTIICLSTYEIAVLLYWLF